MRSGFKFGFKTTLDVSLNLLHKQVLELVPEERGLPRLDGHSAKTSESSQAKRGDLRVRRARVV